MEQLCATRLVASLGLCAARPRSLDASSDPFGARPFHSVFRRLSSPLADNIGEFFQSSLLPIAELMAVGVLDDRVLLAPEVGGWPLKEFHTTMLNAFTKAGVRTTGHLAPHCAGGVHCAPPRCFERMLICRFRDVYDAPPPIAPWRAARAIVASFRKPGSPLPPLRTTLGAGAPFVVLFARLSLGRG